MTLYYGPWLANPADVDTAAQKEYLLIKRGLYYRPDNIGYTGIKDQAGRYNESDAYPDAGVTAIHQDSAPDYSAACWPDIALEHVKAQLAASLAREKVLREALDMAAFRMQLLVDRMPLDEDGKGTKKLSQGYVDAARAALKSTGGTP